MYGSEDAGKFGRVAKSVANSESIAVYGAGAFKNRNSRVKFDSALGSVPDINVAANECVELQVTIKLPGKVAELRLVGAITVLFGTNVPFVAVMAVATPHEAGIVPVCVEVAVKT